MNLMKKNRRRDKYQHILLDADQTLLNFKAAQKNALLSVFARFGFPDREEEIIDFYDKLNDSLWKQLERKEITKKELIECRFRIMCDTFGVEHPGGDTMEMHYQDALSKGHDLMPGAFEVCETLSRTYTLSLVTNGTRAVQIPRIEECTLKPFFQHIFISEEMGYNKPDVKFFEIVHETLGYPDKETMLIVGDSMSSDMKGGVNFGIDTCHIMSKAVDYKEIVPTYTIESIRDIYKVL